LFEEEEEVDDDEDLLLLFLIAERDLLRRPIGEDPSFFFHTAWGDLPRRPLLLLPPLPSPPLLIGDLDLERFPTLETRRLPFF
jgi:hypothetical protein